MKNPGKSSLFGWIDISTHRAFKAATAEDGLSMSSVMERLMQEWLDQRKKKPDQR